MMMHVYREWIVASREGPYQAVCQVAVKKVPPCGGRLLVPQALHGLGEVGLWLRNPGAQ